MNKVLFERNFGDVKISVIYGDITEEEVDAIVNAANSHLSHGGGVAGAIARRGGEQIRAESRKWIEEHGIVPAGSVAVTGAGNLSAKYVIHAVGPRWGEGDEETKLKNAVRNALEKAGELKCESISIPAISTGIFGFPKKPGAKIIVDEAIKFAKNPGTVREIRFCNIDAETSEIFKNYVAGLNLK